MAEWTDAIYRLVGVPAFYKAFQNTLGARQGRHRLMAEIIRPSPGDRVLDLGCGSAAILEEMPDEVRYFGIDHNPEHITEARTIYGDRGVFHAGDFSEAAALSSELYDIVLALGLLHHLDDDQVVALMRLVHGFLSPTGRFITIDPVWVPGQSPIARLLLRNDSGRNIRNEAGYVTLSSRVFPSVECTIRHDLLRVPYTHCLLMHRKGGETACAGRP